MAEQDDSQFRYSAPRRGQNPDLDNALFEEDHQRIDDFVDDYNSESANDEYLDDDFDEDDFIGDGYDDFGDNFLDGEEVEYLSTPPGAFYRACARQLRQGPRLDHGNDEQPGTSSRPVMTQDRGPSYML